MTAKKLIIDCDPGQDDAVMLLMALSAPADFEILGVTAVAGNVPLEITSRNIRILTELSGRHDIPTFAGCDRPLVKAPFSAEYVHGQDGIDGMDITTPMTVLQPGHAVDFIIKSLELSKDNDITIIATGPLTNIATVLERAPHLVAKIEELVIMGGAMREGGNVTPSAEFNIFVDPHAADIVFKSGLKVTTFGLDVTHKLFTTPDILKRIEAIDNAPAQATYGMLTFFSQYDSQKYGEEGAPLHDPCTIAYLMRPDLFEIKSCNIRIETSSELTLGHMAVDFWHVTGLEHNAAWAWNVDREGFYDLLIECLNRYPLSGEGSADQREGVLCG